MMLSPLALRATEFLHVDLDAEYAAMEEALRMLSGPGRHREAIRARSILLNLANSGNPEVSSDARKVLREANARQWFSSITPSFEELERIASDSIRYYQTQLWRKRIVRVILAFTLAMVVLVVVLSLRESFNQSIVQDPIVIVFAVLALFTAATWMVRK